MSMDLMSCSANLSVSLVYLIIGLGKNVHKYLYSGLRKVVENTVATL